MSRQERFIIAVVGATGAVGEAILSTLLEREFPIKELRLMASSRSAGKSIAFGDDNIVVEDLSLASFEGVDFAFFSAGGATSKEYASRAREAGAVVIDNTSAFRMDDGVPLVVPEVNSAALFAHQGLIANPNCSTIQMVMALQPLAKRCGLKRVIVSTYQSASGAGQGGVDELMAGTRALIDKEQEPAPEVFAHPLAFEVLPQIDSFEANGYTREEMKMIDETRKIMDLPELAISATCVRVPVLRGHSEAVTVDLEEPISAEEARALWRGTPGVKVVDDPMRSEYPRARQAAGTDPCWVGRVRQDLDDDRTLHFWVVADNLRKGAALNAVQIAERLVKGP